MNYNTKKYINSQNVKKWTNLQILESDINENLPKTDVVWVNPSDSFKSCKLTSDELNAASATARRFLLRNIKPVPEGKTPRLIMAIGAPGSGKSSLAMTLAKHTDNNTNSDYVVIDFDTAVQFHPRYNNIWTTPDGVNGDTTNVGFTLMHASCNNPLESMLDDILTEIISNPKVKYNIIVQSHIFSNIIIAKLFGYNVSLFYVGVPVKTAIARARARAIKTGKFLSPTLKIQDDLVREVWNEYIYQAPWYGLWANKFYIVNNSNIYKTKSELFKNIIHNIKEIKLDHNNWSKCIKKIAKLIDEANKPY